VVQVVETAGDREESDEVMTKSRVWLSMSWEVYMLSQVERGEQ